MILNIKAYPDQILSKLDFGFKDIEIQLHRRIFNEDKTVILNAIDKGANIHVVHSALVRTEESVLSVSLKNCLINNDMFDYINDTFIIADFCARKLGHKVGVLIHNGFTDSDTDYFTENIKIVISKIANIYNRYKDYTYLLIENEVCFLKDYDGNYGIKERGYNVSQSFVISQFKKIGILDIQTVVDTCHLMIDNNYRNKVFEINETIDWDKEFSKMKDYNINVGLLHLSRCEKTGLNKYHGLPFNENSKKELYDILNAKNKHYPNAKVTIEVYEDNYYEKPINYITEKVLIEEWEKNSNNKELYSDI
jgi:hypothetical protein